MNEKELLAICEEFTLRTADFSRPPIFRRGKGTHIWDVNGKEYLDMGSGQMCATLGHNHPSIVEAIHQSCKDLIHSSSFLLAEKSLELAWRIGKLVSPPLKASMLLSTGSEANEVALSIAKKYTGGYEAACFHISYTGRTAMAKTTSPSSSSHKGEGPLLPGIFTMPGPYCYRCPVKKSFPECEYTCLDVGFEMLDLWAMGPVAAIFAEGIFGPGGIIEAPPGYFKALKKKCEERGILLVLDEMQTAFGRCGAMFAYEQEGIVPDILTLSKTMGGGIAVSSTTTTSEIKKTILDRGFFHSATHAFDPLPAYVTLAIIDSVEKDNLVQKSKEKGDYLIKRLRELGKNHSLVGDVRGRGLLQGIELVEDRESRKPAEKEASMVYRRCIEKGLLLRRLGTLKSQSVLNFSPPFYVTEQEMDKALNILDESLSEVERQK